MHLLYVLRYWPTRTETFVRHEIAGLIARGHRVVVAAIGARADGADADPVPGLTVWEPPRGLGRAATFGPARRVAAAHPALWGWLGETLRPGDLARAAWVAERAAAAGVDRIHAHFAGEAAEWASLAAAVCGRPWSVTVHAVDLFRPRPSVGRLLWAASPVVTVCAHHAAWIEGRYGVIPAVVRCGVDPGRFPTADPGRERPGADPSGPLRIASVARWAAKKGLDTLLDAVHATPDDLRLRLVADAPPQVASPRVAIGALPPREVPAVLAGAELFALPCRVAPDGDRDGVPVALIEAMAAGLPVIATPVAGISELVDETVGWVVPPDDVGALVAAIREAAADPAERAARGRAGQARVRAGWTIDGQVDGLLAAWGVA